MGASQEIQRLCESWWERLSDATKSERQRFSEQYLSLLGWEAPAPLETKSGQGQFAATSFVLRAGAQASLAAHFVMPGSLDPPSVIVERGLDFCEATRVLTELTRNLNINYCLVTDLFRSYVYDTRTQELLLYADSPTAFRSDLAPVLHSNEIENGSLEEARRQPRSYIARQLREWCYRWTKTIAEVSNQPEEIAVTVIDRLLVLRYLLDHDILKRPGWRLQSRFIHLVALAGSGNPRGSGKGLVSLFHDIWFEWKAQLFEAIPAVEAVLEQDSLAAPLLSELSLLSRSKFTVATVLESFNYGEATEKARVRMIPEEDSDRNALLARQTSASVDNVSIEIDLEDEGYRAIPHWFDKLTSLYERLNKDFDVGNTEPEMLGENLDLFEWSAIDASRPLALSDRFQHAVEKGLVIYYTTTRQLRTSRLLLYLHLIGRYEQSKTRFTRFPNVGAALRPRPRFLASDKKAIFQPWSQHRNVEGW